MTKLTGSSERLATLVQRLRDDIQFGAYDFGQWLKLIDLQRRYDATQFEIRQALNQLKPLKLVEHRENHGFRVATPDPAERLQMRYVRVVLERSAAPMIAARATEEDATALAAVAKAFDDAIAGQSRPQLASENQAFHRRLYAIADNPVLEELIHSLRDRSHYGTTGRWRSVEGLKASSDEHFQMVEAIRRRDPTELERLIVQHIESF